MVLLGWSALSSCSNDFEMLAPHRNLPLVYGVLDAQDTLHYIRVERTFAGEANALDMAKNRDSVYYQHVTVNIERWKDRTFAERYPLAETDEVAKDSGIFAWQNNQLFVLEKELDPQSEYRLEIKIDDIDLILRASTVLVSGIKLIKPTYSQPRLSLANYELNTEIEWLTNPNSRLYLLEIALHYLETTGRDTIAKTAIWPIGHFLSEHRDGGERMETMIPNYRFFQWMASRIPEAEEGMKRILPWETIDLTFTIGGEELYTYLEINQGNHNPMISKPVYTNIENGIGLLSSRTTQIWAGRGLPYATIDSVAHGQYTRHLGFVDTTDDYYSR